MDSPALSIRSDFSDMDDDELDLYLSSCVPLSSLPTPPPAKEAPLPQLLPATPTSTSTPSPRRRFCPELEVYATNLGHLVPRRVASPKPDVAFVSAVLERANLPLEIVAFAACILEKLSWRTNQPTSYFDAVDLRSHVRVAPDLMILSALCLAHGFVDDRGRSNRHWALVEAAGRYSAKEVDAAKMQVLQDIDYNLFRISEESVPRTMLDLQRACQFPAPVAGHARHDSAVSETADARRPKLALSTSAQFSGTAMWLHGVQTPEPSP